VKPILLDTHVALWSSLGMLTPPATATIDAAARASMLLLSPISAWEIGMLARKNCITIPGAAGDFVRNLFAGPGVILADLTPAIACAAGMLDDGFHGDPADRVIIASAIAYGADLMTRDDGILAFAKKTKTLHCMRC
jgi:PIN domain nuclease of toxin-antitoxin system